MFDSGHLTSEHLLGDFDSGVDQLDNWLRSEAVKAAAADLSRTYVWTAPGEQAVVGYFVLVPTIIAPHTVPRRARGPYSTTPVTGYLIAKLALAQSLQGRGLGRDLLLDACGRAAAASHEAGGRLIVVDAIDGTARGFYERYGFKPIEDSNRLYMRVVDFNKTYADATYGAEERAKSPTAVAVSYKIWSADPPGHFLALQFVPVSAGGDSDRLRGMLLELGFVQVEARTDLLPPVSTECLVDNRGLTIRFEAKSGRFVVDTPVPGSSFLAAISQDGFVDVLVTTDSFDDSLDVGFDEKRHSRDIEAGGVLGARMTVGRAYRKAEPLT